MTDRSQVQEHQADEKGCRSCRVPPGQLHDPGCGADPEQGGIDYDYYARARVSYEQLRRWLENSAQYFEDENDREDRHSQFHVTLRVAAARLKKTEIIAAHILAAAGAAVREDPDEAYHFLYWAAVELTSSDDPEALDRLADQVSVVEDAEIADDLRTALRDQLSRTPAPEAGETWDGDEHTARWVGSGNYLQGEGPEDAKDNDIVRGHFCRSRDGTWRSYTSVVCSYCMGARRGDVMTGIDTMSADGLKHLKIVEREGGEEVCDHGHTVRDDNVEWCPGCGSVQAVHAGYAFRPNGERIYREDAEDDGRLTEGDQTDYFQSTCRCGHEAGFHPYGACVRCNCSDYRPVHADADPEPVQSPAERARVAVEGARTILVENLMDRDRGRATSFARQAVNLLDDADSILLGMLQRADTDTSGEIAEIVEAALNHCAECLSFRPDEYTAGDDLDRALTRVRHLREEYGDEEAGSGGWATRYKQDVCALLRLIRCLRTDGEGDGRG